MTDKVQKIREEVARIINRRLNLINGDYFDLIKETNGFTNEIMSIINSLQEEPNILPVFDEGYWERLGEEPVSEDLEKAINDAMPHRYCWSGDGKPVYTKEQMKEFFKTGVQWQKKQFE